MEILEKEVFFSKQGKASSHTNALLFHGVKKRPKAKVLVLTNPANCEYLLQVVQSQRRAAEAKIKAKPNRLTSAFTTTSRNHHDNAFRNRTESPHVGLYTPCFTALDARVNQGPKYHDPVGSPREKKILLPSCIDEQMKCNFYKKQEKKAKKKGQKDRVLLTVSEYQEKIGRISANTPVLRDKIYSPIEFDKQLSRTPFVKPGSPPHEKRFSQKLFDSCVHSNNKKACTISFNKMLSRSELIKPKDSVGPYDIKDILVKPRIATKIIDFGKMGSRKPMLLEQQLHTPMSPELEKYDKAFNKQSKVRG